MIFAWREASEKTDEKLDQTEHQPHIKGNRSNTIVDIIHEVQFMDCTPTALEMSSNPVSFMSLTPAVSSHLTNNKMDIELYLAKIILWHVKECSPSFILWWLQNIVEEDTYRIKIELWAWRVVITVKFYNILVSLQKLSSYTQ